MNSYNLSILIKRALFYKALFILFLNCNFAQLLPDVQSSSLWVVKEDMTDTSKINSIFNFADSNNIDKLFIEVLSNGESLYNSNLIPQYIKSDTISFDPLNYFLNKANNYNIEIHASINAYLLWSQSIPPLDTNHYYYNCNDCFEKDFNGKSDGNINLLDYQSKKWEGIFISPIHPEVNKFLFSIVGDLIENYNIHGIHFNYLRYQDSFYGYNNKGIENFIDIYNFNPKDINRGLISTRFGYSKPEVDSLNSLWDNYRISKITELVRSVKYKIITDSLNIKLSASVKPNFNESKNRWYQDWMSWIDENIIDFVIVKNFDTENKFLYNSKFIANNVNSSILENKIYMGLSTSLYNLNKLPDQILFTRLLGYKNFNISSYETEQDTLNLYAPIYNVLNFNLDYEY